jgi:hypothetical protein
MIRGEYLGEPVYLRVEDGRIEWSYSLKPGHRASQALVIAQITAVLRPARLRGLGPFHGFAIMFAIGAYFAHLPWLAIALSVAGLGHALYRLVRTPQVLVLTHPAGRVEIAVAWGSLAEARQLVASAMP